MLPTGVHWTRFHTDIFYFARFATYRTAAKIRYVQRKGYLHHIDIWNVIEAFRENGLNTMEATTLVNRPRLETLLSSLYTSLNKRLPPGQNINVEKVIKLFLWIPHLIY
jgi:EF hand